LKKIRRQDIRKGMVMLQKTDTPPQAVMEFVAEGTSCINSSNVVMILYHQTTIKPKYQAMLHVNATAQTCQIISIELKKKKSTKTATETSEEPTAQILRTGDRGLVRFRFMQRAEYLKIGTKLIFREGRTKGLGTVTQIFPAKEPVAGTSTSAHVSIPAEKENISRGHVRSSTKDSGVKNTVVPFGRRSHNRQTTGDSGTMVK
jgi:hypothetical protein